LGLLGWLVVVVVLATAVRFVSVFILLLLSIFVYAMRVDWNAMTGVWKERGTRVLTYMSPFFSDPSAYSNSTTAFRHNFFQEGMDNGYFVHRQDGSTYLMYSLSIRFAMLDLTNPAAVAWMQDIIVNQSVEEAGSSGWMCDFGEYLPFDAVLHSVSS
jgi:sulfoquinovosidase